MSVGNNIKRLRESRSLSLSDFASMTGMTVETCESIESGHRSLSSTEVQTICKALDVTFDVLVAEPHVSKESKEEDDEEGGSLVMPVEELQNLLGKMNE
ncbi:MAG: helix-turn-helix transcriptional regulator [Proteobacteria bacterium]|nr:helix-turn-helix transcriptional regulator [Pseudomonadota bacterium]